MDLQWCRTQALYFFSHEKWPGSEPRQVQVELPSESVHSRAGGLMLHRQCPGHGPHMHRERERAGMCQWACTCPFPTEQWGPWRAWAAFLSHILAQTGIRENLSHKKCWGITGLQIFSRIGDRGEKGEESEMTLQPMVPASLDSEKKLIMLLIVVSIFLIQHCNN